MKLIIANMLATCRAGPSDRSVGITFAPAVQAIGQLADMHCDMRMACSQAMKILPVKFQQSAFR